MGKALREHEREKIRGRNEKEQKENGEKREHLAERGELGHWLRPGEQSRTGVAWRPQKRRRQKNDINEERTAKTKKKERKKILTAPMEKTRGFASLNVT